MMPHLLTHVRRIPRHALALALLLPLVAWTGRAIAIASLTLSPTQLTVGSTSTGTVTLDAPPAKGTLTINLASATPAVATVPASVSFSSLTRQSVRSFSVQALALGCSQITAFMSGSTKTAVISVPPPADPSGAPSLSFSSNPGVAGTTITGTVTVFAAPGTYTVSLASSNTSVATVPTQVSVTTRVVSDGPTLGSASFPISTPQQSAVKCSVISATRSGITGRKLLTLFPISG